MHAAPTDFTLCSQSLSKIHCDVTGLPESFGNAFRIRRRILGPFRGSRCGVDANDAITTNSQRAQFLPDATSLANLEEKPGPLVVAAHGPAAARRRPHR